MFEQFYELYMRNMVSLMTLNKLINAEKLTQSEVDVMAEDRLVRYGY